MRPVLVQALLLRLDGLTLCLDHLSEVGHEQVAVPLVRVLGLRRSSANALRQGSLAVRLLTLLTLHRLPLQIQKLGLPPFEVCYARLVCFTITREGLRLP